jgi:hypothetical protein
MTASTTLPRRVDRGTVVYFPGVTETVTVPRKRRALWHWPWWWPAALRDRLARMERNWDAISVALAGYEGCPS